MVSPPVVLFDFPSRPFRLFLSLSSDVDAFGPASYFAMFPFCFFELFCLGLLPADFAGPNFLKWTLIPPFKVAPFFLLSHFFSVYFTFALIPSPDEFFCLFAVSPLPALFRHPPPTPPSRLHFFPTPLRPCPVWNPSPPATPVWRILLLFPFQRMVPPFYSIRSNSLLLSAPYLYSFSPTLPFPYHPSTPPPSLFRFSPPMFESKLLIQVNSIFFFQAYALTEVLPVKTPPPL